MPVYQYECEKCRHQFDIYRDIAQAEKEPKCPKCGAEHPKRIFSAFNSCSACEPQTPWVGG